MKKRVILGLIAIILIFMFSIGISTIDLGAAKCYPKDGSGTCEGECCRTLLTGGCVAGPCSEIL